MVACNTYSESPNKEALSNCVLKEDERWTSNMFSFKGDSLLSEYNESESEIESESHITVSLMCTDSFKSRYRAFNILLTVFVLHDLLDKQKVLAISKLDLK